MLLSVLDSLLTGTDLPLTPRGDDLQLRSQSLDGKLETDLIVAFARSAVSDSIAAFLLSDLNEFLSDDRTSEGRAEEVFALIDSACFQRRPYIARKELRCSMPASSIRKKVSEEEE